MKVDRTTLLSALESVMPGVSKKGMLEQSSCVVFKDKQLITFNDEICCRIENPLPGLTGAIPAVPLLSILRKMVDDEIDVESEEGELIVKGKRNKVGIKMEADILLPVESIEAPGKWSPLPEDFLEAVALVQECTGKDALAFVLTCVHFTPEYIEATDLIRMSRYKLNMGTKEKFLLKGTALQSVSTLSVSQISITPKWIHFKSSTGLILSCRRFVEDYPNLTPFFDYEGDALTLPKGLFEAADRASIFSSENIDENYVKITLSKNSLVLQGVGVSGWYMEKKKIRYDGQTLTFIIAPTLLMEISKKYNECVIADGKLAIDGGNWRFVTTIGNPEADSGKEEVEEETESDGIPF